MRLATATEWVTVMAGRLTDHLAEVLAGAGAQKTEAEVVAQFERWAKNPATARVAARGLDQSGGAPPPDPGNLRPAARTSGGSRN